MKRFIKNSVLITVLINFCLSLQLYAAKPVDTSAERAQRRLGRIKAQVEPKEQPPVAAAPTSDESAKRAQDRLKRIGGQLQQPKQQSAIAPEDVGATSQFIEKLEYCQAIRKTWKDELRKYGNTIIQQILENEERYRDTHFVFYHGQRQENRIIIELLRNLYNSGHSENPLRSDFEFLRFWKEGSDYKDVNSYLDSFGIPNPFSVARMALNDLKPEIRTVLLSVNAVLFGNFDQSGSCTWNYFLKNFNIDDFVESALKEIFTQVNIDHKFITDLSDIVKRFPTRTGDLVQIFIPKNMVNEYAYLSEIYGIPKRGYIVDVDGNTIARDDYDQIRQRYVRSSGVLEFLQVQGKNIKDLEHLQLRLFFSKTGPLLNPDMGARMFRFTTLSPEQMQEYRDAVETVSNKLFANLSQIKRAKQPAIQAPRTLSVEERGVVAQTVGSLTEIVDLFDAISDQNAIEQIKKILAKGVDINIRNEDGQTPLIYAAKMGKLDVVQFLVAQGADINIQDQLGRTSLMYAIKLSKLDVVKFLIEKGAAVDVQDIGNDTALTYAVQRGSLDVLQLLSTKGATVNIQNRQGWTPLMYAGLAGKIDVIGYLIQRGADLNATDNVGDTALIQNIRRGKLSSVYALVEGGADINSKDKDGKTAINIATERSGVAFKERLPTMGTYYEIQRYLEIKQDQQKNKQDDVPLLMRAAFSSLFDLVHLILKQGNTDVNVRHKNGATALMYAVLGGNPSMVKLLIEAGADINAQTNGGKSVIAIAEAEVAKEKAQDKEAKESGLLIIEENPSRRQILEYLQEVQQNLGQKKSKL
ncbi:MAG TPA: ankyrin repeat domain-containing protein [Candidatus Babeliales bacterium]|nr:ankyrin repeat domain-containing protein [Candidatus Babeliales bacterium]